MRQKIKKILFYAGWLVGFSLKMILFLIISAPLRLSKKYKDLWIISERPEEARDNGYWLFDYIITNHPETNVRYVLSKKSVDYSKIKRKDLVIEPKTAEHYICYILSSYSVSTHMHGACPGKSFCIPFLPLMRKKQTVFLQHGIVKDKIKFRGGLDAIIASSESEKRLIADMNPNYKDKIHVTGLCRYDQLTDLSNSNGSEKIILVMPTFRKWLRDIARLKEADILFKETKYYKRWNSFLANDKLIRTIEENNVKIIFFPHNEMQLLSRNFSAKSENITIGAKGEFDVQTLLRKASLLVTDYSSVFFDFSYMHKPVFFYQFDQDEFFKKHYQRNGEQYPFGETYDSERLLVDKIIKMIISKDYSVNKKCLEDIDGFFEYRDKKNSERNYNTIKELEK